MIGQHIASAFIAIFLLAPTLWMAIDRGAPYDITNGSVEPAEGDKIVPGSRVTVRWDVKILRDCSLSRSSYVDRTVVDKNGFPHPIARTPATYGARQASPTRIVNGFPLPSNMPPGLAIYQATPCYACNPIQEYVPGLLICVRMPEVPFTVSEP